MVYFDLGLWALCPTVWCSSCYECLMDSSCNGGNQGGSALLSKVLLRLWTEKLWNTYGVVRLVWILKCRMQCEKKVDFTYMLDLKVTQTWPGSEGPLFPLRPGARIHWPHLSQVLVHKGSLVPCPPGVGEAATAGSTINCILVVSA
jgi:hypothetical protein